MTYQIPRSEMPQIKGDVLPDFIAELKQDRIRVSTEHVPAGSLKPTQADIHPELVARAGTLSKEWMEKRPIIISRESQILDGHHRWTMIYSHGADTPVYVLRVDLPIIELIKRARNFSQVVYRESKLREGIVVKTANQLKVGDVMVDRSWDDPDAPRWASFHPRRYHQEIIKVKRDPSGKVIVTYRTKAGPEGQRHKATKSWVPGTGWVQVEPVGSDYEQRGPYKREFQPGNRVEVLEGIVKESAATAVILTYVAYSATTGEPPVGIGHTEAEARQDLLRRKPQATGLIIVPYPEAPTWARHAAYREWEDQLTHAESFTPAQARKAADIFFPHDIVPEQRKEFFQRCGVEDYTPGAYVAHWRSPGIKIDTVEGKVWLTWTEDGKPRHCEIKDGEEDESVAARLASFSHQDEGHYRGHMIEGEIVAGGNRYRVEETVAGNILVELE